jgi:two-component system cell cycle sensor histidine kinase/response regulator CckA
VRIQIAVVVADLILSGENKEYSNYDNIRIRNTIAREKDPNKDNSSDDNNNKRKFKGKIFVIDDDPDIAYVLKRGLQKNGFLVDAFTNPEEALRSFESNPHDLCLVVSDVRMPGLSGIQLARKVKQINQDIKVVLMTSFEIKDNEFSKVFPSTQVDGFVQKPISIADLTSKILDLIGETRRSAGKG